jgi:hypothetical protein
MSYTHREVREPANQSKDEPGLFRSPQGQGMRLPVLKTLP